MNRIYFGDNLPVLKSLPSESVDLIYIDPPFNTGKIQKHTRIKTFQSENGSRKGFMGKFYETQEIGTKAYQDVFDFYAQDLVISEKEKAYDAVAPFASLGYLEVFLAPRLEEALRVLKPFGSIYFHIDYREAHYCKILLDRIFGRESFLNEIIWAYDYGGRPKSRWPPKHDTIFLYAKDPQNYIFNTGEIDREQYMAPGLVGPEKAKRGKLPTDTWWFPYVGGKSIDTWWNTIVGTNSKERTGYPTQKPQRLINRMIKASSLRGSVVLDFFAGSGTVGASCLELNRNFILIDNNLDALEAMAQRFESIEGINWINFDPSPYQTKSEEVSKLIPSEYPAPHSDFQMLAAMSSYLQRELEEQSDLWKDSPLAWILQLPARKKGKFARRLIIAWLESKGLEIERSKDSSESLTYKGYRFAIKFSTLWKSGDYRFQQIRSNGYHYLVCLGISPTSAHCWIFERKLAIKNAVPQHRTTNGSDYWIAINPSKPPDWAVDCGGTLDQAYAVLRDLR